MLQLALYLFFSKEYHTLDMTDVYSQIVFNRTADEVTKFEEQRSKPAFTPSWILKVTWDHVMPVSYQKINFSEVKRLFESWKYSYVQSEKYWEWMILFFWFHVILNRLNTKHIDLVHQNVSNFFKSKFYHFYSIVIFTGDE